MESLDDKVKVINDFSRFLKSLGITSIENYENLFDFIYRLKLNSWDFYKMDPSELQKINNDYNDQFTIIYGYSKYNKH